MDADSNMESGKQLSIIDKKCIEVNKVDIVVKQRNLLSGYISFTVKIMS